MHHNADRDYRTMVARETFKQDHQLPISVLVSARIDAAHMSSDSLRSVTDPMHRDNVY